MPCLMRKGNQLMNTKLKDRMSCKQYMKNKPISGGVDAAAKQDICMSLIFILAKEEKQSLGLGKQLFWICLRNQEIRKYTLYSIS